MYKKDTASLYGVAIFTAILSWHFNFPFETVASDAITVVSIADALYVGAATLLIGTRTAEAMKHQDKQITTKTKMGVFISYLKRAIVLGIFSILVSIISKAYFSDKSFCATHTLMHCIVSAFGSALFVTTLYFIIIIFKFICVTLNNESHS